MRSVLPPVTRYQTPDLVEDLLGFAAHHLLPGGRLVYFLPVIMARLVLLLPTTVLLCSLKALFGKIRNCDAKCENQAD